MKMSLILVLLMVKLAASDWVTILDKATYSSVSDDGSAGNMGSEPLAKGTFKKLLFEHVSGGVTCNTASKPVTGLQPWNECPNGAGRSNIELMLNGEYLIEAKPVHDDANGESADVSYCQLDLETSDIYCNLPKAITLTVTDRLYPTWYAVSHDADNLNGSTDEIHTINVKGWDERDCMGSKIMAANCGTVADKGDMLEYNRKDPGNSYLMAPISSFNNNRVVEDGNLAYSVHCSAVATIEIEILYRAHHGGDNSCTVAFDRLPENSDKFDMLACPEYCWNKFRTFQSDSDSFVERPFDLTAGFHTLNIGTREDGTRIRKVRIVDDTGSCIFLEEGGSRSAPVEDGQWTTLLENAKYGGNWDKNYKTKGTGEFMGLYFEHVSGGISCTQDHPELSVSNELEPWNNCPNAHGRAVIELQLNDKYVTEMELFVSDPPQAHETPGNEDNYDCELLWNNDIACRVNSFDIKSGDNLKPTWYNWSHDQDTSKGSGEHTINVYGWKSGACRGNEIYLAQCGVHSGELFQTENILTPDQSYAHCPVRAIVKGYATFEFYCSGDGQVEVSSEVIARDGGHNSFYLNIDEPHIAGVNGAKYDLSQTTSWEFQQYSEEIPITKGFHTLYLTRRENHAKVRQIKLSTPDEKSMTCKFEPIKYCIAPAGGNCVDGYKLKDIYECEDVFAILGLEMGAEWRRTWIDKNDYGTPGACSVRPHGTDFTWNEDVGEVNERSDLAPVCLAPPNPCLTNNGDCGKTAQCVNTCGTVSCVDYPVSDDSGDADEDDDVAVAGAEISNDESTTIFTFYHGCVFGSALTMFSYYMYHTRKKTGDRAYLLAEDEL